MKKFLLSLAVVVSSAGYVALQYVGGGASATPSTTAATQPQSQPLTDAFPQTLPQQKASDANPTPAAAQPGLAVTPTPPPKPRGQYADGTYTGAAADAYYGMVQVEATVSGGTLRSVSFLQYPSDRSTSRYINSQAMPMLTQEALQAQNANVDIISGATDTSMAFQQSLGDALSQAKNG